MLVVEVEAILVVPILVVELGVRMISIRAISVIWAGLGVKTLLVGAKSIVGED